jgi:hypothetical protein
MKTDNSIRLARIASADVINGGARASVLASRMFSITGSDEGRSIVSRVYSNPRGVAVYECRECGGKYLTLDDCSACCAPEYYDSSLDESADA